MSQSLPKVSWITTVSLERAATKLQRELVVFGKDGPFMACNVCGAFSGWVLQSKLEQPDFATYGGPHVLVRQSKGLRVVLKRKLDNWPRHRYSVLHINLSVLQDDESLREFEFLFCRTFLEDWRITVMQQFPKKLKAVDMQSNNKRGAKQLVDMKTFVPSQMQIINC